MIGASVGAIGGVVAALLVAAVSLVTCSRGCRAERAAASVAAGWPSREDVAAFRAVVNRRLTA